MFFKTWITSNFFQIKATKIKLLSTLQLAYIKLLRKASCQSLRSSLLIEGKEIKLYITVVKTLRFCIV